MLSPKERAEVTALRLAAQRIAPTSRPGGSEGAGPAEVVRWMLAMQAQDFGGAKWAVGLRSPGSTDAAVEDALAAGEIVRSWPMRGTLHVVAPEDLWWMLGITASRQRNLMAKRRADLGISESELARAADIASEAMSGGRAIRRDHLLEAWEAGGVSPAEQRAYHLLWNLGHDRHIVFGPVDGKQQTFVLFDEWITHSRRIEGDEALGEFASRYYRSHGPATERDFAWWSSLTLGDARRGIAAASGLERREFGGVEYHLAAGAEPVASPGIHVLPGFDEYLLGYQDRTAALAPENSQRVVPGNNGIFLPTIVINGAVAGTWKRTEAAKRITIDLASFDALSTRQRAAAVVAVSRYGEFRAKPVALAT